MIGEKLAHYEVTAKLGVGGMGEVYRARDTKLDRDVALKLLPPAFASDPERVARFQREARTLASLNHPNIASIYGFEEVGERRFLVMELVDGEDLSTRIAKGALPLQEALAVARQIAEGLEEAHEQGVVHRDLKPANVKLTPEGKVKILDFGLARAFQGQTVDEGNVDLSPTITAAMTQPGMILGTAAYMAPEQAKGRTVDRRADLWAFGVILWEMLTGRKLFTGDDISDTLAAVLRDEPKWDELPAATPPAVRELLQRCLERDPRQRLRDIGEARVRLEQWTGDPSTMMQAPADLPELSRSTAWSPRLAWALVVVATLAAAWGWLSRPASAPQSSQTMLQLDVSLPGEKTLAGSGGCNLEISPDGSTLVYRTQSGLYLKRFDQRAASVLAGTESAGQFTFSPDGRWIAFQSQGRLWRVSITGGAPIDICALSDPRGIAWVNASTLVVTPTYFTGLSAVSLQDGSITPVTTLDEEAGERTHRWPQALPDQKSVIFLCQYAQREYDEGEIRILSLDTKEVTAVHRGGSFPRYAASGHLLFVRDKTLFASPLDLNTKQTSGLPVPVLSGIWATVDDQNAQDGSAQYDVSDSGMLVYRTASAESQDVQLVRLDLETGASEPIGEPGHYTGIVLSPDGLLLATVTDDDDIYLLDLQSLALSRFTFSPGQDLLGCWSADSQTLYWSHVNEAGEYVIMRRAANGSTPEEEILASSTGQAPASASPDGKWLTTTAWNPPDQWDVVLLSLEDPEAPPRVLAGGPDIQRRGYFSPDGSWFSYFSHSPSGWEIQVRPFPDTGAQWRIASAPNIYASAWLGDGSAMLVRDAQSILRVPLQVRAQSIAAGRPVVVRQEGYLRPGGNRSATFSADGRLAYLMQGQSLSSDQESESTVVVVTNWLAELERLAPHPR